MNRALFLDPSETPDHTRRRSLLYMAAFCAVAMAGEWQSYSAGAGSWSPGAQWLLWLVAGLTGAMALCLRLSISRDSTRITRKATPVRAQRSEPADSSLSTLPAWRRKQTRRFLEFGLDFTPDDTSGAAWDTGKATGKKRRSRAEEKRDPFAQALEDFSNREKGRFKR